MSKKGKKIKRSSSSASSECSTNTDSESSHMIPNRLSNTMSHFGEDVSDKYKVLADNKLNISPSTEFINLAEGMSNHEGSRTNIDGIVISDVTVMDSVHSNSQLMKEIRTLEMDAFTIPDSEDDLEYNLLCRRAVNSKKLATLITKLSVKMNTVSELHLVELERQDLIDEKHTLDEILWKHEVQPFIPEETRTEDNVPYWKMKIHVYY